ncbi:MerR family transcriptional regulator [Novosphingopyxis sp. YJ-S2-01]|uniref:MerR family transcriptional regulator n=1 Tax=Novosphingopyxis sp. YJ-S2-01 TaxID=2794021 RepID=UPI0018DE0450|nr:MerR family transcriptional regulator [Novosphingopyxis sp. YJ-S2-01]MBH9536891.1 MerR family transcriptional regulator [Novosphingopyxis sp. YJ-S2-01]
MADEIGVKPHILRYWEEQFPMLTPLKRAGGRRHYRAEDAALVREIRALLQERGFTIKGARRHLEAARGSEEASAATENPATENDPAEMGRVVEQLEAIRQRLESALDAS